LKKELNIENAVQHSKSDGSTPKRMINGPRIKQQQMKRAME
jgi:hypothetical protein